MKRRAVILGACLCAACDCRGWDGAFERMVDQPKYESYAAAGDGQSSMRPPPEDAVAVDAELGPVELTEGGSAEHPVGHFPLPVTPDLLIRGRDRFGIFCAPCHGIAGDGESVIAEKMQLRQPPSLGEDRIRRLLPGQLFRVVQYGYGLMPDYSHQLSLTERWAVVAYVQALQMSQGVPIVALPESVRAEALRSLK